MRPLVAGWLRRHAEVVFRELFDTWSVKAERYGIVANGFQIRRMTNRWGSCTLEGNILLKADLVVAPTTCIKYVAAHELCHLKHHKHSSNFYRLLQALFPDRERRRERPNLCVAVPFLSP